MKKRLRKKLYLAEYKELGFVVDFELPKEEQKVDEFIEQFLTMIDENGMACSGGGQCHHRYFVVLYKRGSVSQEQRQMVAQWLEAHQTPSNITVGELIDAWY